MHSCARLNLSSGVIFNQSSVSRSARSTSLQNAY
jgi:hypothetical protein